MKRSLRLLVIGGVAAGTRAASKARREDPSMEITIITEEEYISYAGCGLAYYVGGLIDSREKLFARSPEVFREKHNISVLLRHRAERIDTYDREVHVSDLSQGKKLVMPYDRLLIATGASAVVPPVEGIDLDGIFVLHNIPDAEKIKSYIDSGRVRNACIMGGGYIGVEMAENLVKLGIPVMLFEAADILLPRMLDPDIAGSVSEHMEKKGVRIRTGSPVERFLGDTGGAVRAVAAGGSEYECDLAVIATGVKPNVNLASDARIVLGPTGAIRVDNRMETSVRGIYAAGDCAESVNLVCGHPYWMPLGSTANKMGRVAGANIAGGDSKFPGVFGTAIVKAFDLAVGRTGISEREAKEAGFNPVSATVTTPARPAYYPGGGKVTLKLIGDKKSQKLLGAQAVGDSSVDKIIDTAAASLMGKATVPDLTTLDLAYSPPYAPALGAVIVAAQVLEGKL